MTSIDRRDCLAGLSGLALGNLLACSKGQSGQTAARGPTTQRHDMRLRPHHILDIVSDHGHGVEHEPHPYGHSLHTVAPKLLSDLDLKIELVLAADDICEGCQHLMPDGQCRDVLAQLEPSPSKQAYNDVLDSRLFDHLSMEVGSVMTTREYLERVNEKVPGIERICTHPKESQEDRLNGLIDGLTRLGIRDRG